jgi:hypothetical protein
LRQSVQEAQWFKARAARAVRDNALAFGRVMDGLHTSKFGNLRQLSGQVDALGRERNGSKINPAGIRAARGKVARARQLAPVVTVRVQTRRGLRNLSCAPLPRLRPVASNDGARGFLMLAPRN